ncbi:MAG TPA: hypothetical protein VK797_02725 [Tepidisphaeraceae bacterium]|jgi:hypothetical protein|nr:hypothetical protein [Tepidisphaeraceae bacterium]
MKPARKTPRKTRWVLAMAVGPVLTIGIPLGAQIATQDGHALDANIRVGSGGYNYRSPNQGVTPNQIIYGNVTGGQQFRGPVLERDPGAFTGPTAGFASDRFIATSSAAPAPYQPSFDLSSPIPFYGISRGVAPPPGTERLGYSGAYIGGGPVSPLTLNQTQYKLANDWQAQSLGVSTPIQTRTSLLSTPPDELFLQIPQGSDNQLLQVSGSPLYGIQALPTGPAANPLDQYGLPSMLLPGVSADRFRFDQAELVRMRGELQNGSQQGNPQEQQPAQGSELSQPLNANPENPSSSNSSNSLSNSRFSTDMQNPEQSRRLVPPELQSTQYAELSRRLAGTHNDQYAALQAVHESNVARRAAAARAVAAASQPSQGVVNPPPGMMRRAGGAAAMLNLPVMKIHSVATGVRAKGLHDLLSSAEDLMRQGKFQSAIDRYNMAQQVAPNNPLVAMGRANAELGAGAYRQASNDLRLLFVSDPATLMAQYDLAAWFPPERLKSIKQELSDLSSKDTKDEMSEFLLAYLAYNTGDSQAAARHLEESRKRSGGKDPALDLMQTDWKLSAGEKTDKPAAEFNNK